MRGRGLAAALVAVLVLLVVPLGLVPLVLEPLSAEQSRGESPGMRAEPGDPAVATAMTCDDPAEPADAPPTDVVAARLCATDNGLREWYAPQDSLYADLGLLVDLLGELEPVPESTATERYFCTNDGGVGLELRLASAAGNVISIPADTGGCSTVRIGDEDLVGSDEVVATFLDLLAAQREITTPPASLEPLDLGCRTTEPPVDHRLSLIGDPAELVEAVTCWRPNADEVPPWRGRVRVPARLLSVLVDDLSENSSMGSGFGEPDCPDRYYWQDIVGHTVWGDVVVVRGVCREFMAAPQRFRVTDADQVEQPYWHPSPRAQRILDDLRR